ncbi:MAG TPA: hypothetical protein VMD59_21635, partial [Acidimicrobiales bacterium]|nr:hypothetical protein [Acidimicrobiales bacterium]
SSGARTPACSWRATSWSQRFQGGLLAGADGLPDLDPGAAGQAGADHGLGLLLVEPGAQLLNRGESVESHVGSEL